MSSNGVVWEELASQWSSTLKRAKPDLISKIWTTLDAESFAIALLARLDALQVSEKLLWPTFDESSRTNMLSSFAVFINYKKDARLLAWPTFTNPPDRFSLLFRRILSLSLDPSTPIASKTVVLTFVTTAFQSLEQDPVRKECAPLVSIGTWDNLHSEDAREIQLDAVSARRKAWRSNKKRVDTADQDAKLRMRLERAWLFNMLLDFLKRINTDSGSKADQIYCAKFLEFLVDLISQLPTRRYSIVLLKDLNVLPLIKISYLYNKRDADLFRDLTTLLELFQSFQIDDVGEVSATRDSAQKQALAKLQKVCLQQFEEKLKVLALSNYSSIAQPEELQQLLSVLSDLELEQLCNLLNMRTSYPQTAGIITGRRFFLQILTSAFAMVPDLHDTMQRISVMPTEQSLYDPVILRNETYTATEPLALPKLNLQYLTLNDFLWRSFRLQQAEAFYEIRKDMESIVRKMKPHSSKDVSGTNFGGFSKMAIPIDKPAVIDVLPPKVGEVVPGHVRAEVVLDVSRLGDKVRSEWESLRPRDTGFPARSEGYRHRLESIDEWISWSGPTGDAQDPVHSDS